MIDHDQIMPNGEVDPRSRLIRLQEAYDQLLSGKATATVRYGDREFHYQKSDLHVLERELIRLRQLCARVGRHAAVARPRHHRRGPGGFY